MQLQLRRLSPSDTGARDPPVTEVGPLQLRDLPGHPPGAGGRFLERTIYSVTHDPPAALVGSTEGVRPPRGGLAACRRHDTVAVFAAHHPLWRAIDGSRILARKEYVPAPTSGVNIPEVATVPQNELHFFHVDPGRWICTS